MRHFFFPNRCAQDARRMAVALLFTLGILGTTSRGESVVDFQDLTLAPNSYWNGSDGSGGFYSKAVHFNNSYDQDYGSWSGWSYSNVNDVTTAGYDNQYAAYSVGGSGNYTVGYVDSYNAVLPTIIIPNGMQVQSAMFTNTTYAAFSMLIGDQYAKKFGPDDWFRLTITGKDTAGGVTGTVSFDLASQGNVVKDWTWVGLTALGQNASTIEFGLDSSDHLLILDRDYGMSTPAYFAMDNLTLSSAVPEPSTLALFCGAGIACAVWGHRRRSSP